MPVNWKEPDAFTRLLAAMVAAQDMKVSHDFAQHSRKLNALLSALRLFIQPLKKQCPLLLAFCSFHCRYVLLTVSFALPGLRKNIHSATVQPYAPLPSMSLTELPL